MCVSFSVPISMLIIPISCETKALKCSQLRWDWNSCFFFPNISVSAFATKYQWILTNEIKYQTNNYFLFLSLTLFFFAVVILIFFFIFVLRWERHLSPSRLPLTSICLVFPLWVLLFKRKHLQNTVPNSESNWWRGEQQRNDTNQIKIYLKKLKKIKLK